MRHLQLISRLNVEDSGRHVSLTSTGLGKRVLAGLPEYLISKARLTDTNSLQWFDHVSEAPMSALVNAY